MQLSRPVSGTLQRVVYCTAAPPPPPRRVRDGQMNAEEKQILKHEEFLFLYGKFQKERGHQV